MKINVSGRKMEVSDSLNDYAIKKIGKLSKFFDDNAEANVTLSAERKGAQVVEATIYANGMIYRAEEKSNDMYASIDKIGDIIERQIRKNKTRLEKRLRSGAFVPAVEETPIDVEEETEFNIVKTKRYSVKPMSPEEAILQMNLIGHEFFVFKDAESDSINIVYKRTDGDYGLIETDNA